MVPIRKVALRSPCRYRVAALVFDSDGNVLACAHNLPRLHKKGGGIHAELAALRKCNPKDAHTIQLVRIGRGGELRPIHPCASCLRVLKKFRIRVQGRKHYPAAKQVNGVGLGENIWLGKGTGA